MNTPVTQLPEANAKFAREAWIRALERTASIDHLGVTLPVLIGRLANEFDAAPALVSTEATLSYRELAIRCNQYARWGLAQGLKPGDTVGLMMPNCAEYMAIWLGLTRIGVVVALSVGPLDQHRCAAGGHRRQRLGIAADRGARALELGFVLPRVWAQHARSRAAGA